MNGHVALYVFVHTLSVASANKIPFCSLKSSQHKVSTNPTPLTFLTQCSMLTTLTFHNAHFSKRTSCLKKKVLRKGRRAETVMARLSGQKGCCPCPHLRLGAALDLCVILGVRRSQPALLFPDDFTEKQRQMTTRLFC